MRDTVLGHLDALFTMHRDLVDTLPTDSFAKKLPAPSNTIGEQFWCLVGTRESFGVRIVADGEELERAVRDFADGAFPILVQERIEGPGLGAFFLSNDGEVVARRPEEAELRGHAHAEDVPELELDRGLLTVLDRAACFFRAACPTTFFRFAAIFTPLSCSLLLPSLSCAFLCINESSAHSALTFTGFFAISRFAFVRYLWR